MSGASNFALIVMSIGCVTLGLPLERKQVAFEPQLTYEVIKQGPPCETTAKIGDDVKLALSSFREVGDDVERGPELILQYTLGDAKMSGMDEALVGMCPEDIRLLTYDHHTEPVDPRYSAIYEVELISIDYSDMAIPAEMDTNGDNVLSKDELTLFMALEMNRYMSEDAIDTMFSQFDTNGNGVLAFSEIQTTLIN